MIDKMEMENKNSKALQILQEYVKSKRDEYSSCPYNNKLEYEFSQRANFEELKDIGPFNEKEAFAYRKIEGIDKYKSGAKSIDPRLYNKRFTIGDFEIIVTYMENFKIRPTYSNSQEYNSLGYKNISGDYDFQTNVFLKYRGNYKQLLESFDSYDIIAAYCKPTQTNWHWLKPTKEKPYILRELIIRADYDKISFIDELFSSIDIDSLELKDSIIKPRPRYSYSLTEEEKKEYDKIKTIHQLSCEEIDIEWFVKQEIKNGVYRPEGSTIAKWIYNGCRGAKYDKNLLKKLGVHTVQLRADAHFSIEAYYDLSGIVIKAPKTVIERYGLEKYCKNKDIVEKIKKEQKKREDEIKARDYNSRFTLMQHGKVIKKDAYYHQIIEYLENFVPASTIKNSGSSNTDIDDEIIKSVQFIFDEYQDLDKIYLGYWGTYYKYELRGQKCDFDTDCNYLNRKINKETYSQIIELYDNELYDGLNERAIVNKYGWPEAGFLAIGVKRVGDKIAVFTEDYDLE